MNLKASDTEEGSSINCI